MRQVLEQKTTLAAASGVLIIMAICGLVCLMGKTCHEEKRKKKNSLSPRTHSVKSTPAVSTTSITALTVNWPQEKKSWSPKILSIENLWQNQDLCGHLALNLNANYSSERKLTEWNEKLTAKNSFNQNTDKININAVIIVVKIFTWNQHSSFNKVNYSSDCKLTKRNKKFNQKSVAKSRSVRSSSVKTYLVKSTPSISTTSITALTVNWPQEIKSWPPKILSIKKLTKSISMGSLVC